MVAMHPRGNPHLNLNLAVLKGSGQVFVSKFQPFANVVMRSIAPKYSFFVKNLLRSLFLFGT